MKRTGVLRREALARLRWMSRKFGWYSSREDIWHLLDTVDAQRLVIDRYAESWHPAIPAAVIVGVALTEIDTIINGAYAGLLGYWVDSSSRGRTPEPMTLAEQAIVYDRTVRSDAPDWPEED